MSRFEVSCPAAPPELPAAVTLTVDAEHWLAALRSVLERTGRRRPAASILCDVQADGSIHVVDTRGGGVIRIRELRDGASAPPAAPVRPAPAATPVPPPAPAHPSPAPWFAAPASAPPAPAAPRLPASPPRGPAFFPAVRDVPPAKPPPPAPAPLAPEVARGRLPARTEDLLPEPDEALALLPSVDRRTGLERILDAALAKIGAEAGSLLLTRAGGRELEFVVVRGPSAKRLLALRPVVPVGSGVVGYCVREGLALAVSDVHKDPRFLWAISLAVDYETRSILCAPITRDGEVLGALELLNKRGGAPFCADDLSLLTKLAAYAAEHLARHGG
jgi:hypothetical protein